MGKKGKKTWNSIPLCIFWYVRNERNRIAFKDGILALHRLKYYFLLYIICEVGIWCT